MSWCDGCFAPGRCCSRISINSGTWGHGLSELDLLVKMASAFAPVHSTSDIGPLMPLWRTPEGKWTFWCPALTREGRCSVYETRPGMCVTYEPGHDGLCVFGVDPQFKPPPLPRTDWEKVMKDPRKDQSDIDPDPISTSSAPFGVACAAETDLPIPTI